MPLTSDESSQLRQEILLGFHKQFAENQRSREDSFLKFLALLGGALAGYVFLFRSGGTKVVPPSSVYLFQLAVGSVLFAGAWLVVTISNNFRRDQFVNVKIRRACGLIGSDEIFPPSYDPRRGLRTWGLFGWIPDFFAVFYWLFVSFEVAAFVAFVIVSAPAPTRKHADWFLTATLFVSAGLIITSLTILPWWYRRKLLSVMKLNPDLHRVRYAYRRARKVRKRARNRWRERQQKYREFKQRRKKVAYSASSISTSGE